MLKEFCICYKEQTFTNKRYRNVKKYETTFDFLILQKKNQEHFQ